jgi:hypothetical protein
MSEAFTTWKALKQQILNDLVDPSFRKMGQYTINAAGTGGSRSVTYRSLEQLKSLLDWVEKEEAKEEGVPPYVGRAYAKNNGRG